MKTYPKSVSEMARVWLESVERRAVDHDLTPQAVLAAAGMTPWLWYQWQDGRSTPTFTSAERVEQVLRRLEQNNQSQ